MNQLRATAIAYTLLTPLGEGALIWLALAGHPLVLVVAPYPLFGAYWAWRAVYWRNHYLAAQAKYRKLSETVATYYR